MSLSQEEVYAKGERICKLEEAIELHICFWSMAAFPTSALLAEFDEMLSLLEEVKPYAKGDTSDLDRVVKKWERKRAKYAKYLKEGAE